MLEIGDSSMKIHLLHILKGFIIGASMSVPGVSGGTMAILLGIYDKLISGVSHFFKNIKENIIFLGKICIGAALGIFALASTITWLLEKFPIPVSCLFLGAVIGGIPALYNKTKEDAFKASSLIFFVIGLILVISIGFLPTDGIKFENTSVIQSLPILFIAGIIIAIALVLPGISTSHMLLVLGLYDVTMEAIKQRNLVFLGVLGTITLLGIFLTTKPLEWVMNKYTHKTYWMIIGFVIGSTYEIVRDKLLPAIPSYTGINSWFIIIITSAITFIAGFMGIKFLSRFSND